MIDRRDGALGPLGQSAAQQYRSEAARLRAMADESTFVEVKRDLAGIAREYEALAEQREDNARRFGDDGAESR
jgi:hypothetical protein